METEPLNAYSAAYDALADTPVAADDNLRRGVAERVVAVLKRLRRERGLRFLRGLRGTHEFNEAVRVELEEFSVDSTLITGRVALHRVYEATAETFIAAYGRTAR